ncbi:MAG: hypothetical protein COX62_08265 [Deltaproteobacteria bacterium CG_4_10_14_0_2_um_filter_43_8]|nr:MAG: hypothetical protein COV43_09270 [Deltaproteobacteria bacterium CG11_big_fil_rev_8_21_14_0_20_42_23]PJA18755.1 MAG: hypothetical protein COX62_08265 [Deltaproteobacteria bacterium CG_4_10_14_0_2_um_filter_43_8]PJC64389.1 MAG: hypothetical protein CO021_05135 [Deltaproteobacteria bacterium CG_4_9_14_0_2_um_filter_42_21]
MQVTKTTPTIILEKSQARSQGVEGQENVPTSAEVLEQRLAQELDAPAPETSSDAELLNAYTFGSYANAAQESDLSSLSLDKLRNFPPSFEELATENLALAQRPDIGLQKYESLSDKIDVLIERTKASLADPSLKNRIERQTLTERLQLLKQAKLTTQNEIEKLYKRIDAQEDAWMQERIQGADLNQDGWMGKPNDENSLRVIDGNYFDKEGNPVDKPYNDINYTPSFISDSNVEVVNGPRETANSDFYDNNGELRNKLKDSADIHFQLKETPQYAGEFGTEVNINVPQYIWVETEEGKNKPKQEILPNGKLRYTPVPSYDISGRNVSGKLPEDMSKAKQVEVAKVMVHSRVSGVKAPEGSPLYHQVVDYLDRDGNLIMRMEIQGNGTDADRAASSVAMTFSGNRTAVEFDASKWESTGRFITKNIENILKLDKPELGKVRDTLFDEGNWGKDPGAVLTEEERAAISYHQNISRFRDKSPGLFLYNREGNAGKLYSAPHYIEKKYYSAEGNDIYSDSTNIDARRSGTFDNNERSYNAMFGNKKSIWHPEANFRSGLFIHLNNGGIITGTKYDDVIVTDNLKGTDVSTIIDGGGGTNIYKGGNGSVVARNFSFVSKENDASDKFYLSTIAAHGSQSDLDKARGNVRNYVQIKGGGTNYIDNPEEIGFDAAASYENGDASLHDDYYGVSGTTAFSNIDDDDVAEEYRSGKPWDASALDTLQADAQTDLLKIIRHAPGGEGLAPQVTFDSWKARYGSYAELASEVDQTFDAFFVTINEIDGDIEDAYTVE